MTRLSPTTVSYSVTLRDRTTETITGADAFLHEKVMTTFYRTANARGAVDCWAVALASFRTEEILMIRRIGPDLDSWQIDACAREAWGDERGHDDSWGDTRRSDALGSPDELQPAC